MPTDFACTEKPSGECYHPACSFSFAASQPASCPVVSSGKRTASMSGRSRIPGIGTAVPKGNFRQNDFPEFAAQFGDQSRSAALLSRVYRRSGVKKDTARSLSIRAARGFRAVSTLHQKRCMVPGQELKIECRRMKSTQLLLQKAPAGLQSSRLIFRPSV